MKSWTTTSSHPFKALAIPTISHLSHGLTTSRTERQSEPSRNRSGPISPRSTLASARKLEVSSMTTAERCDTQRLLKARTLPPTTMNATSPRFIPSFTNSNKRRSMAARKEVESRLDASFKAAMKSPPTSPRSTLPIERLLDRVRIVPEKRDDSDHPKVACQEHTCPFDAMSERWPLMLKSITKHRCRSGFLRFAVSTKLDHLSPRRILIANSVHSSHVHNVA
jgi:hypothetical protein